MVRLIAALIVLFVATHAFADELDPKDEALAHWKRGLELYEEQDYANALIEFRKAYSIAPTYKVLYNIGQVCFQLTDYACALTSFQQYLKDGDGNIASDRKKEVEKDLEKLKTRVGSLEIVCNIASADVFVDDVAVGKTPLTSFVVSAGRRKITVSKDGYGSSTRIVEVAGTDSLRVEIHLVDPAPRPRPPPPAPIPSRWTTLSFVGVGVGSALAITGGVTGFLALRAEKSLEEERYVGAEPSAAFDSKSRRVQNLALATDLLLAGAAITIGTTLVLTLTRTPRAEHPVSLRVGPTGLALSGSF